MGMNREEEERKGEKEVEGRGDMRKDRERRGGVRKEGEKKEENRRRERAHLGMLSSSSLLCSARHF
jgi:hypothetical protein